MNKYELTDERIEIDGRTLYRIRALRSFHGVKTGDLGGFIESEANLSQCGECWVFNNACIYRDAKVLADARIYENARVSMYSHVSGKAQVFGSARICGYAWVCGHAKVSGSSIVGGDAMVFENAQVEGNSWITEQARVGGTTHAHDAYIDGKLQVGNDGSINTATYVTGKPVVPNDLEIGDIVTLNSGGPEMTITAIDAGLYTCVRYITESRTMLLPPGCMIRKVVV